MTFQALDYVSRPPSLPLPPHPSLTKVRVDNGFEVGDGHGVDRPNPAGVARVGALLQHERLLGLTQTLLGVPAAPPAAIVTVRVWERGRNIGGVRKDDEEE